MIKKSKEESIGKFFEALSDCVDKHVFISAKLLTKISNAIVMERNDRNMSQTEFASFMGVTQGMVSKWESGDYNFTIDTIAKLCDKLDYEVDLKIKPRVQKLEMFQPNDNWKYPKKKANRFNTIDQAV